MQDVWPNALDDLLNTIGDFAYLLDFREPRHVLEKPARRWRAIEFPAVDKFFIARCRPLFRAG